jgi:hypothetical protein
MANLDSYYLTKTDGTQFYPVANWDKVDDKPDLSIYAKTTDLTTAISQIPTVDLSGYVKTSDLSNYATKDDLQKLDNEITTLQSPDGSTWFLSVDNNGRLSTSKLVMKGS